MGGILVGSLVRYCRSFWPAFVLHMMMGPVIYTFWARTLQTPPQSKTG
jgi:hypothetical protein